MLFGIKKNQYLFHLKDFHVCNNQQQNLKFSDYWISRCLQINMMYSARMCSAMCHQPDYAVKKVLLFGTSLVHPETRWDAAKKYEISVLHFVIYFYHSPMKLHEGNVFSCVCLSVDRRSDVTITLDLTIKAIPSPSPQPALLERRMVGL